MDEDDDEGKRKDRKWWQRPEMLSSIATLITAIATLVGVLTGNGSGPA
jgi:hypothetical protein